MTEDLKGTLGGVQDGIEKSAVILGPFERVVGIGNLIRQQSARFEVQDADGVHLVADEVVRVGQQAMVGADREIADAKVRLAFGQYVAVEQNFLGRIQRSVFA